MSCRVIGLDVEIAALAEVCRSLGAAGAEPIVGEFQETDANFLCRDLFERCGWQRFGDVWRNELQAGSPSPSHVAVIV
jgi:predicted enzyme involved in methoxymalonyl-ACP biosynthesis